MFIIDDKIVSTEVFTQQFICNLSACKGACCWEGDFGAPVSKKEERIIEEILPTILPLLSDKSKDIIVQKGSTTDEAYLKQKVTPLHKDGSCVYLTKDKNGIAKCAFEQAWEAGDTSFKKPISCHLYPVRVVENEKTDFEALNYDEWDICSAACKLGQENQMPVFRFVQDAIKRQYGQDFYDQMEDIYKTYFM